MWGQLQTAAGGVGGGGGVEGEWRTVWWLWWFGDMGKGIACIGLARPGGRSE